MITHILIFIISLVALIWSADKFIDGASTISHYFGISPFVIGLTIVAIGSSAPEMFIAGAAAINDQNDTAIGNVLGSNIANIHLILGSTALVRPILIESKLILKEFPLLLLASTLGFLCLYDGQLSRINGLLLLLAFLGIMSYLTYSAIQEKNMAKSSITQHAQEQIEHTKLRKGIAFFIFGLLVLPLSADYLIESASAIARYLGLSELIIGLTIMAIGTSLPELAAALNGILKNEYDLIIGNIIGSNIFNILAVLAIPALLNPTKQNNFIDPLAISRDLYIMLGSTLTLILLIFIGKKPRQLTKVQGAFLLITYLIYQYFVIAPFI